MGDPSFLFGFGCVACALLGLLIRDLL